AVAVEVTHRHVDPSGEARVVGEEAGQQGAAGDLAVGLDLPHPGAVDHHDLGTAAGTRPDHHIGMAVGVEGAGGDVDPAGEGGAEGEEASQQGAVGDLAVGQDLVELGAVNDLHLRPTAGAGSDDQVRDAVAVDVGDGDVDPSGEGRGEGEEVGQDAVD